MNIRTMIGLGVKWVAIAIALQSAASGQVSLLSQNDVPANEKTVTIYASSTYPGTTPARAIDGDLGTDWLAYGFSPQNLTLNLQASYYVTSVALMPNTGSGGYEGNTIEFKIRGSNDGATFHDMFAVGGELAAATMYEGQPAPTFITFSGLVAYQYVQISFTGGTSWPNVRELEVYGSASPIPEPATVALGLGLAAVAVAFVARRKKARQGAKFAA